MCDSATCAICEEAISTKRPAAGTICAECNTEILTYAREQLDDQLARQG